MKHILLFFMTLAALGQCSTHVQKKTFVRDYTYQAIEDDSENSAWANAATQIRHILLHEVGEYLQTEQAFTQDSVSQEYFEKVDAITAGIVEMKTLDERWDGATYYIKAEMTINTAEMNKQITEVLNDRHTTRELEEARKRILTAKGEATRLRKELEEIKDQQQRLTLQKKYRQITDTLSAEEYFTRGRNAYENNFNELAIEYYQKVIAIDPNHVKAYNNMGITYINLGNYDKAMRCHQQTLDIDRNYAAAYSNIGGVYYDLKYYDEATRWYIMAEAMNPNHAHAYGGMGYISMLLHKATTKPCGAIKKAVDMSPNLVLAYYNNMGLAYINLQNYQEAIWHFQKAIDFDLNDVLAYYNMGNLYYTLQNYQEAIWYFQKVVTIDKKHIQAYINIGNAYYNLGNQREQITNYQKAARLGDEGTQEWLRKSEYSW
jgi:tetratricopeptide (TPR) repeat protein